MGGVELDGRGIPIHLTRIRANEREREGEQTAETLASNPLSLTPARNSLNTVRASPVEQATCGIERVER